MILFDQDGMAAPTSFKPEVSNVVLATRPAFGTKGRALGLRSNAFAVRFKDMLIYQYDVSTSPLDIPKKLKRQIWAAAEAQNAFSGIKVAYDGEKIAFSPIEIPVNGENGLLEITVPLEDGGNQAPRNFKLICRKVQEWNTHEVAQFLQKKATMNRNILTCIAALNVMIRHEPATLYQSKGSSIYPVPTTDTQKMVISGALEIWRGFYSSIRCGTNALYVNIDSTAAPFVIPGDLHRVSAIFCRVRDPSGLARLRDTDRLAWSRFLKGLQVSAPILGSANNQQRSKFKIKEVSKEGAATLKTTDDTGRTLTVAQFFKGQGYNVQHANLPCILLTKRAWYPIEMCKVEVGNKKNARNLTPDQVAEVLKFTTKKPSEKQALVREGLRLLNYPNTSTVQSWNFQVNPEPMEVPGRVLQAPVMQVKDKGNKDSTVIPRNGTFDLRGKKFFKPARIDAWGVIVFDTETGDGRRFSGLPRQEAEGAIGALTRACQDFGMQIPPKPPIIYAGNATDPLPYFKKLRETLGSKIPSLVVCMLSDQTSHNYGAIKSLGDIQLGVATQVLRIQKARSAKMAYMNNVALKINVKLSGINATLAPGSGPMLKTTDFATVPTLILGADVAHSAPGSVAPSIAALVGTNDLTATGYSTVTRVQQSREEIILDLENMSVELIKAYYKASKKKPARILFYRDGVSEGQFGEVSVREVLALKRACAKIDASYKPAITYIICGKRHHIRFFPKDNPDDNAPAGTVVDQGVCSPQEYDWYLLSHAGLLGTSKPTHYTVLLDENKFTPDDLQQITFNLAWLYPRSLRSVSIASPAYFADLVCTRSRYHLGVNLDDEAASSINTASIDARRGEQLEDLRKQLKPIHENLNKTLFFM